MLGYHAQKMNSFHIRQYLSCFRNLKPYVSTFIIFIILYNTGTNPNLFEQKQEKFNNFISFPTFKKIYSQN